MKMDKITQWIEATKTGEELNVRVNKLFFKFALPFKNKVYIDFFNKVYLFGVEINKECTDDELIRIIMDGKKNRFSFYMKTPQVKGQYWNLVRNYQNKMGKFATEMSIKDYCSEIDEFQIAIRISGVHRYDDVEGCNTLRFFKKESRICNSISFDEKIYSNEDTLKEFLKENIVLAYDQMIKRLEKEKIAVNSEKLLNDVKNNVNKCL